MKLLKLISITTITAISLFASGDTYYSFYKNIGGFTNLAKPQFLSVNPKADYNGNYKGDYTLTWSDGANRQQGSVWNQKDNFLLYVPKGIKAWSIHTQINGSYNSMDAFSAYNKLPVIKQPYDYSAKSSSQIYIDANNAGIVDIMYEAGYNNKISMSDTFNLLSTGKTITNFAAIGFNLGFTIDKPEEHDNDLGKWIITNTSNEFYCKFENRRELCNNLTYDNNMDWAFAISIIFDRNYIHSHVTTIDPTCQNMKDLAGEDISEMCTYLKSLSNSTNKSRIINGKEFLLAKEDPDFSLNGDIGQSSTIQSIQTQNTTPIASPVPLLSCNDILTNKVKLSNKWYMVGATKDGCNLDALNKLGYKSFYYENSTNTYRNTGTLNINDGIWIIKVK